MMKRIGLLLFTISLCFLVACSTQREVSGRIIETNIDENTGLISFVIHADNDKDVGILLTDETSIFSFVEGITADEFKTGSFTDVVVSVEYDDSQRSLTTNSNQEITAYNAKQIQITGILTAETAALSDGTTIEIWNCSNESCFTLPNGIELMRIQCLTGPDNVYVGGVESFDDLCEEAQKNVMRFYDEQGLLYDVQAELEKAYDDYLQQEDATKFNSYMISQDISPTASNETVMYFLTSVLLPIDGNHCCECRIGAAFDRKTGDVISNWDLFSCSPEEAIQTILEIVGVTDLSLREEMEKAFKPESIILFPDNLEVCFPQGSLPSQEYSYMIGLDYDDKLSEILNQWAIPESNG